MGAAERRHAGVESEGERCAQAVFSFSISRALRSARSSRVTSPLAAETLGTGVSDA
jgi:hypothetical protein